MFDLFSQKVLTENSDDVVKYDSDANPYNEDEQVIEPVVDDADEIDDFVQMNEDVDGEYIMESAIQICRLMDDFYLINENTLVKIKAKAYEALLETGSDDNVKKTGARVMVQNIIRRLSNIITRIGEIFGQMRKFFTDKFLNFNKHATKIEKDVINKALDNKVKSAFEYEGYEWKMNYLEIGKIGEFMKFADSLMPENIIGDNDKMSERLQEYKDRGWKIQDIKAAMVKDAWKHMKIKDVDKTNERNFTESFTMYLNVMLRGGEKKTTIKGFSHESPTAMIAKLKDKVPTLNTMAETEAKINKKLREAKESAQRLSEKYADSDNVTQGMVAEYILRRTNLIVYASQLVNLVTTIKIKAYSDMMYEYLRALSAFIKFNPKNESIDYDNMNENIIVFGSGEEVQHVHTFENEEKCPNCNNIVNNKILSSTGYVHLYWIIKFRNRKGRKHFKVCPICNYGVEMDRPDVERLVNDPYKR